MNTFRLIYQAVVSWRHVLIIIITMSRLSHPRTSCLFYISVNTSFGRHGTACPFIVCLLFHGFTLKCRFHASIQHMPPTEYRTRKPRTYSTVESLEFLVNNNKRFSLIPTPCYLTWCPGQICVCELLSADEEATSSAKELEGDDEEFGFW